MNKNKEIKLGGIARAYLLAKREILSRGYEAEISWQESVSPRSMTPQLFMREAAWVILCSGMSERVIRARFPRLEDAFACWVPYSIAINRVGCRRRALKIFHHLGKIDAIIEIAEYVAENGIAHIVKGIEEEGPEFLSRLPYVGSITCRHLAKNMGCPTSKSDRHLQRVASVWGFTNVTNMCESISNFLNEPIQVVDIVLWRFATLENKYPVWLKRESGHWSVD